MDTRPAPRRVMVFSRGRYLQALDERRRRASAAPRARAAAAMLPAPPAAATPAFEIEHHAMLDVPLASQPLRSHVAVPRASMSTLPSSFCSMYAMHASTSSAETY